MIRYVVDASAVGPVLLRDERSSAIPELMRALDRAECAVPPHWRFEVANMVLVAVRRGRIDAATAAADLSDFALLPVQIDIESLDRAFDATLDLATQYGLTEYDAAYLELASRLNLILISQDGELLAAARKAGVEAIGP